MIHTLDQKSSQDFKLSSLLRDRFSRNVDSVLLAAGHKQRGTDCKQPHLLFVKGSVSVSNSE